MSPTRFRPFRLAAWGLPGLALAAQLVPVARVNPPVTAELHAPPVVHELLVRACYDCHSHRTDWPWYSGVAPVSWLVARDVRAGREELNFSSWDGASDRAARRLRECAEELREGEMPPTPYLVLHPEARLDPGEREALLAWLDPVAGRSAPGRSGGESP